MKKDYHKGKKINAYINDELYHSLESCAAMYGMTKTAVIEEALYSYIGAAARASIHKAHEHKVLKTHAKVDTLYNNSDTHK